MTEIIKITSLLCFIIAQTILSNSLSAIPARSLENEELVDSTNAALNESELSPRIAIKRVTSLLESLETMKDKCNKYMFIVKNYVAFYQDKSTLKLQEEMGLRPASYVSVANRYRAQELNIRLANTQSILGSQNMGSGQDSGNFGSTRVSGNMGSTRVSGNMGNSQASQNLGGGQASQNLGGAQASNNFNSGQASGIMGSGQASGNNQGNGMSLNSGNQMQDNTQGSGMPSGAGNQGTSSRNLKDEDKEEKIFVQPILRDYGKIEIQDANFDKLGEELDKKI